MSKPGEHKTIQARILKYAQEIGWRFVPRAKAEKRRGFTPHPDPLPQGEREDAEHAHPASLHFGDLPHQLMTAQIRVHALDRPELESLTSGDAG